MIPFHLHAQEEMQISKVFHFKFLKKFFLHLHKLIIIIAHHDEIIVVDNNENFDISHLCNIHVEVNIIPHKFKFFKNAFSFWF
jgi:hypothetical protein